MKATARERLGRLLTERNQYPERAAEIDAQVWQAFGRTVAMLALDMSGFSSTTVQHGIVHFLAMIHQMVQGASPAVRGNEGEVVKQEADNLFAVFPHPRNALEAALDILRVFAGMNAVLPAGRQLAASIGIGWGPTLILPQEDLFGEEMNAACKLGEDLAGRNEILLTAAAYAALPVGTYACEATSFNVSGVELPAYRYRARAL